MVIQLGVPAGDAQQHETSEAPKLGPELKKGLSLSVS